MTLSRLTDLVRVASGCEVVPWSRSDISAWQRDACNISHGATDVGRKAAEALQRCCRKRCDESGGGDPKKGGNGRDDGSHDFRSALR